MKKFTTTLRLLCFASLLQAQPFTASLTPSGQLRISDPQELLAPWPFDTVAVQFTITGPSCTAEWSSGKLLQASSYTLTLPASYPTHLGFAVRKEVHRGTITPTGSVKWDVAQSGECLALVLPAPAQADTVQVQPISIHIQPGTYNVDWLLPTVQSNVVTFEPSALQPTDAKLDALYLMTSTGLVASPDYLPAGIYFAVAVWEWQGMTFVESDEFIVN